MNETTESNSLVTALNTIAPDKQRWTAGFDAFTSALREGRPYDIALEYALDAAAPDKESWVVGWHILHEDNWFSEEETPKPTFRQRIKDLTTRPEKKD